MRDAKQKFVQYDGDQLLVVRESLPSQLTRWVNRLRAQSYAQFAWMFLLVIDTATPAAELRPEDDGDTGKENRKEYSN